jgi:hypothetical protein
MRDEYIDFFLSPAQRSSHMKNSSLRVLLESSLYVLPNTSLLQILWPSSNWILPYDLVMLYSMYNRVVRTHVQKEKVRTMGSKIPLIGEFMVHIVQIRGAVQKLCWLSS